jgi:hypothetical protein
MTKPVLTKSQKAYLVRLFTTGKTDGNARMRDRLVAAKFLRMVPNPEREGVITEQLTPLGRLAARAGGGITVAP